MASFDERHTWAIVFLPAISAPGNPFLKVPITPDTDLDSLAASRGLTQYERLQTHNGTIGTGHIVKYRVFMLCHDTFFKDLSEIQAIANGFFNYLHEWVDPAIHYDTAYAMTTSVFPPTTRSNLALRALLTPDELIAITRSPRQPGEVEPIRFWPKKTGPEGTIAR